jgi:hypothetical protein
MALGGAAGDETGRGGVETEFGTAVENPVRDSKKDSILSKRAANVAKLSLFSVSIHEVYHSTSGGKMPLR